MHAQRERHRAAGGGRRRGGGCGPVVGGMFGPGPTAFEVGLNLNRTEHGVADSVHSGVATFGLHCAAELSFMHAHR